MTAIFRVASGRRYISSSIRRVSILVPEAMSTALNPTNCSLSESCKYFGSSRRERTTKCIAKELRLGQSTVSTYRARLMNKLNLWSTADLVRYGFHYGLIE